MRRGMWKRNREGKRRKEWKKESSEGEKANERIPGAVFPEAFVCFVFSLVVKWNYCSINRHSPFLVPSAAGERTSKPRSLPPSFATCFSLPVFLSIHPSSSSSRLTFSRLPTFERAHASLVKFARLRTKPTFFSSCTHPRRLLGYLRFLQRLRTEFSSSSSCLILALSVLQSLSCPPRISLSPFRQIKFLEERRKDHLPFFRPSGNLKPVPLY